MNKMQADYRQRLDLERSKLTALTAKLLLKFDGDKGSADYLRLSSEEWYRPHEGVLQKLCDLSSTTDELTVSNIVFEPGSNMTPHRHNRQETLFVLDGSLKEDITGETLVSPAMKVVDSNTWHGWSSLEGALVSVVWRPALCSDADGVDTNPAADEDC